MGNSQQLFQSLFKKDLSANDSKDFLIKLTKEHPYFTAAHFFLLKHKVSTGASFDKEAATTSLLFNNSLWLNFQLDHAFAEERVYYPVTDNKVIGKEIVDKVAKPAKTIDTEKLIDSVIEEIIPAVMETETAPAMEIAETTVASEEESTAVILSEEENIPAVTETVPAMEEVAETTIADKEESNAIILSTGENIPVITEQSPLIEEVVETAAAYEEESTDIILSEEKNIPAVTETNPAMEEVGGTTIAISEEENILAVTETEPTVEVVSEAVKKEENNGFTLPKFVFNKEEDNGMGNFTEEDFEDEVEDAEIEPMNIKLNFTNINTTEDNIAFEPLHVSDYFTSVGIKLTEEVKPGDKLGNQLKSFTQWLKTMKKVHVEQLQEETAENNDLIIQQMAEKSNKEGETLTETMAEILMQQGKLDKAIEVYKKLSLLNPVKSAYFAAKINQIFR